MNTFSQSQQKSKNQKIKTKQIKIKTKMGIKERSGTKSSSARKNNQQVIEKDTLLFSNDRSDDGNVCHSETTVFTSQNSNTTSGTTLKSHIKHSDPSSLPHTNSKKKLWAAEEVPMFLRQRYIR